MSIDVPFNVISRVIQIRWKTCYLSLLFIITSSLPLLFRQKQWKNKRSLPIPLTTISTIFRSSPPTFVYFAANGLKIYGLSRTKQRAEVNYEGKLLRRKHHFSSDFNAWSELWKQWWYGMVVRLWYTFTLRWKLTRKLGTMIPYFSLLNGSM